MLFIGELGKAGKMKERGGIDRKKEERGKKAKGNNIDVI